MKQAGREQGAGRTCVAYGTFDAMHRGHLRIAGQLAAQARKRGLASALVLRGAEGPYYTSREEKAWLLRGTGVDQIVVWPERTCSPRALRESLGACVLVTGESRGGDPEADTAGLELALCQEVEVSGRRLTDEMVGEAFAARDFARVEELCGHPYLMVGTVAHGRQLGRTVGMPTANLRVDAGKRLPPGGVYVTAVTVGQERYPAVTNIGRRPSVDDDEAVTVESFILDFSGDLYDKKIGLEVYSWIRDIRKFDSLDLVHRQVEKDQKVVRDFFRERGKAQG